MQELTKHSQRRRHFLCGALAASAGVAAAMLAPKTVTAVSGGDERPLPDQAKQGYRLTPHIADYYKSASL